MNYPPQPPHAHGYGPPPPMGMPPGPPMGPPPGGGGASYWDVGEVLTQAWEAFKICWGPLVGGVFLSMLIPQIPSFAVNIMQGILNGARGDSAMGGGEGILVLVLVLGASLIGWAIGAFLQVGMTRMYVAGARREAVDFGELFRGANRFLQVLAAQFLMFIIIALGMCFLIVPGVILGLGLMFTQFYVVDGELGPIDAMKASWDATTGHKGKLFLYGLAMMGVVLAGYCACILPVFIAIPVCWLGLAIIYTRLSGTMGGGVGMHAPPPPPPPGFGPPPGAFGPGPGGGYGGPPPPAGGFGGYGPQGGGGYGPPGGGGGGRGY